LAPWPTDQFLLQPRWLSMIKWLKRNGEGVMASEMPFPRGIGVYTRKGKTLYIIIYFWPGILRRSAVPVLVKSARFLSSGTQSLCSERKSRFFRRQAPAIRSMRLPPSMIRSRFTRTFKSDLDEGLLPPAILEIFSRCLLCCLCMMFLLWRGLFHKRISCRTICLAVRFRCDFS
jgi:hypothetical protein